MRIAKWKPGSIMCEAADGGLPVGLAMAFGTFVTQRGIVLVVFRMTSNAVLRCLLEHCTLVAFLTLNPGVLAEQGKAALIMVKFGRLLPAALAVTTRAVPAEGLFVLVIFRMTDMTLLTQLHPVERASMACQASGISMFAAQHVLGVCVMIEARRFPQIHSVATFTFFAKQAFVALAAVILFFVTSNASTRRFLVIRRLVAR
jgi:hypothetical protein